MNGNVTPPGAIPPGVWLCEDYGWLLDVGADGFARWQLAAGGAYLEERGSASDLEQGFDRVTLAGDRLTLHHRGEITPYVFSRRNTLPRACAQPYASTDPLSTFDAVAAIFRDHYAFFAERGIDWDAACAEHRSRIGATTSPDALFDTLAALLEPLRDNHVTLDTQPPRSLFDATLEALPSARIEPSAPGAQQRSWKCDRIAELRARIARGLGVDPHDGDFWAAMKALQPVVARDLLGGRGHSACNGLLHWGEVAEGVGFLAVLRLFGFADTPSARDASDLPRDRVAGARFLADDLAALEPALDRAFAALRHCRALVLDLRLNGGGFDALALAIASRFADRERVAFTKTPVYRGRYYETTAIRVPPHREPWSRPVYLLTSPRTGSAAEILVLAMMAMPYVTRVGEPTLGILSDNLYKRLPNGWEVGLSNERYEAADGHLYEGAGIPPQVEVEVWSAEDRRGPGPDGEALRSGYRKAVALACSLAAAGAVAADSPGRQRPA